MLRLALAALCLSACATRPPPEPFALFTGPPLGLARNDGVVIAGLATDKRTDEPIAGALVVMQCSCLENDLELTTDADGTYRAIGLPSGKYTVQLLYDRVNMRNEMYLPPQGMARADYSFDPDQRYDCVFYVLPRRFTDAQPWVLVGNLDLPLDPPH